jgi:hypothetical protein
MKKISHCINSTRNGTETTNSCGKFYFNQQEIDDSIQNQKGKIADNYKPSVLLFADAGYNSTLIGSVYKNLIAGFNLSIPIYDGNQRQLQTTKN